MKLLLGALTTAALIALPLAATAQTRDGQADGRDGRHYGYYDARRGADHGARPVVADRTRVIVRREDDGYRYPGGGERFYFGYYPGYGAYPYAYDDGYDVNAAPYPAYDYSDDSYQGGGYQGGYQEPPYPAPSYATGYCPQESEGCPPQPYQPPYQPPPSYQPPAPEYPAYCPPQREACPQQPPYQPPSYEPPPAPEFPAYCPPQGAANCPPAQPPERRREWSRRMDWSAGAPPADCGRWVWHEEARKYHWEPAACEPPCPPDASQDDRGRGWDRDQDRDRGQDRDWDRDEVR
jgi:hypothetical protein